MRWLSHISNRIACIYQTTTQWDLPPYWITIWLIDDAMLIFFCLLDDLILGFCYSNLTWETDGFELASLQIRTSITLANRLIKCASHPSFKNRIINYLLANLECRFCTYPWLQTRYNKAPNNNIGYQYYGLHFRSSPPEVFLGRGTLKICNKFTGEHPCWSAISIKLLVALQLYWNHTSSWVFSCKFAAYFQNTFS